MLRNPFFVVSCARSGSTLLSRMLNCHPNLAVPPESHLFNVFYPWLGYYGDLSDQQRMARLITDIFSTPHIQNWVPSINPEQVFCLIEEGRFCCVVDAILSAWAIEQNKIRWGEKTPQHIFYWKAILNCFPDAYFIHLVRDGRDVAMSHLNAPFGAKSIFAAANRWKTALGEVERLRLTVARERFHEVRYEDLLDNPSHELSKICEFLGEMYTSEMLDFSENTVTDYADPVNLQNLQRPILVSNKQKWRTNLTLSEIRVFESVAYDNLLKHRYEVVHDVQPRFSPVKESFWRYLDGPTRKMLAMTRHRRGQIYELRRLRILARLIVENSVRSIADVVGQQS